MIKIKEFFQSQKRIVLLVVLLTTVIIQLSFYSIDEHSELSVEKVIPGLIKQPISYEHQVKPILEKRCIVCHGCYDAPCQLKLSSIEGIQRGASKDDIYDQRRLKPMNPTRLYVDAKTTEQWRGLGFFPVLNEARPNAENNLKNSVMYHLLHLKKQHPQPKSKSLPASVTVALNREQTCPTINEVDQYMEDHPLWGMPYAMPNLEDNAYNTLVSWISQGAAVDTSLTISDSAKTQISQWELFFNESSNKQKLVSRYLYEHLFHAHIHFADTPSREFFRLVRSTTPPGQAIDEIATLRPYDDPGRSSFYYRLLKLTPSIVAKNHIVYELSAKRMQRYQALFLEPEYQVLKLPGYQTRLASNPFKVFAKIPYESRYRFLLDDAHFFIDGFIKGPVCRGQIALNVIEDQFWVMFFDPDQPVITNNPTFIQQMADELQVPVSGGEFELLRIWTDYWKGQKRYMEQKQAWFNTIGNHKLKHAMNFIWDGDGHNPNAALTVFRHFDSGSVAYGLVGDNPETAWVIDYPLFERIHYLLVAGFNVFGNIDHMMSTRVYMDFLRMEGEDYFLAFLPANKRKQIRDSWYQGQRSSIEKLFEAPQDWLSTESVVDYKTNDPQRELYQSLKQRLASVNKQSLAMNLCGTPTCQKAKTAVAPEPVERAMQQISQLQGINLHAFPDVAFIKIIGDKENQAYAYTLVRNKAYKNVTSFLADERERDKADIEKDTMTVLNWLEGNYPNFFFSVKESDIESFTKQCASIHNQQDYDNFVNKYGIRRTSSNYWETADWFQEEFKRNKAVLSGLFDLNRYKNDH